MIVGFTDQSDRLRSESKRLVSEWYEGIFREDNSRNKVVYSLTSGSIFELFRSMNCTVVFPEMNALHCGIKRVAIEMIHKGEALGISPDICGYIKSDIGMMIGSDRMSPFGRIPEPDLIVINTGGCFTSIKWFEELGRYFNCPVQMVDVPFIRNGELTDFDRRYIRGQLEELIAVMEHITGEKFNRDKLGEILSKSKEAIQLWVKLLNYGKRKPSPFDGYFEAVSYMAPLTVLRGTEECVQYYREAVSEIEQRIINKTSPTGEERFRLFFDGAPPWPNFKEFREIFTYNGGVGVAGTYPLFVCAYQEGLEEVTDPLDILTELASASVINWSIGKRRKYIKQKIEEFSIDGIVFHSVKSCRPFSLGQLDMRNYFANECGIPSVFIDSDLIDSRYFSLAQIRNRVDTFFDALNAKRRLGKGR